jgi:hypothetical protein
MHKQIQSRSHSAAVCQTLAGIPRVFSVVALVLAAISPAGFSQTSTVAEQGLWYWFGDCHVGKMMGVEVLLNGKSVYHSEFRACLMDTKDTISEGRRRIRVFYISGGYTFQGTYHTKKTEKIEGNIWQASAASDAMVLGVSFATRKQILLNTLHVAKPGETTRSEIDSGIVVRTYPLTSDAIPSSHR